MRFEDWMLDHARVSSKAKSRLTLDDKMAMFHQLSTLISAGTPLLQALRIASAQTESLPLRAILGEIAARVAAGSTFHAAAAAYPKAFDFSWVEVIRTGEVTGKMAHVLVELTKQVRESREAARKVRAALTYPAILLGVAALAITAMLWFVVPTFAKMFKDMGAELPSVTQFVVGASGLVVSHGPYAAAGAIALALGFRRYYESDSGRRRVRGLLIVVPTAGDLMVQAAMYRFASNFALLLNSGVPMLETLETLRGIFGRDPIYRDALAQAQGRVAAGQSLTVALEETGLFTAMIVNMVRIGEESGQLGPVMEQIAPYYKEKTEALVAKVAKLLEPIIIVGMGSAVAVMMLSIYLPMFEMSGKVK